MRTVLVVEDDFDTLNPLAELLRLKSYEVCTATDAAQGLIIARKQRPDLIITDIALPGKSGLHFISTVRDDEQIRSTPIIVISGCGPMILVEAEAAGANCCLGKPIGIELFWAAVDQVLGTGSVSEPLKPVDWREDSGRELAGEIDGLVEALRHCKTKTAREDVLKLLKERILRLQARKVNCA